jgi:membrane-bound lytic murein transglycosylase B
MELGTVKGSWSKVVDRLRPLAHSAASPLLTPWFLVPMLAAALGASLLPTASGVSASRQAPMGAGRLAAHVSARPMAAGARGNFIHPLPHDTAATFGAVPFAAAPPKRSKHGAEAPPGATAGVPAVAIAAYEHAQSVLSQTTPGCHLTWADVAGIGRVESDNGQTWGAAARITSNGTLFPPIFGIPLDGLNGTPAMRAPGGGWLRAEGPMQFLPATWKEYAHDGNGDGQRNPQNFYDAALTTGVFLCANGGNISKTASLTAAVLAYNHSAAYVTLVESWVTFYTHVGVTALENAGSGLLPVGVPSTPSPAKTPPAAASPATLLSAAAMSSQATGSYSFSFHALAGTSVLATGSGGVDTRNQSGFLVLQLPGSTSLQVRLVGGTTYVSLPPALASEAGAQGPWIALTATALSRLPAPLASGLSLASDDLSWLVSQLAGATGMSVAGHGRVNGDAATEYSGEADLALAGTHVPASAPDLGRIAALMGSFHLNVAAWVSSNRIQSEMISFRSFAGQGPVRMQLSFVGYGRPVTVTAPAVSPISSPTTTTTTTTTTTSTTVPTTTTTAS